MTAKIRLPNIPRSADRDTMVFFKGLKVALETLASSDADSNISAKTRQYIQQLNKKSNQELVDVLGDSLGVGNLLDILNGSITNSQLHKDLSTRIEKITSNENAISQERLERVADVLAANEALIQERRDRAQAITDSSNLLQQDIDAEVLARVNAISDTRDQVLAERNERVADLLLVNDKITQEAEDRLQAITATNTALEGETRDRIAAILAANTAIDSEREARIESVLENSNAIATEAQERADAILATNQAVTDERRDRIEEVKNKASELQSKIDAEGAERLRLDNLLAQDIVNETTQRQNETGVLTEQFNGVYAQVNPRMAGDVNGWAGDNDYFAGVWSLQSARIEDGLATAKNFDVVKASIDSNTATISQVNTALVTKTEVVANQIDMLSAQMVGGYKGSDLNQVTSGLIYQERTARATEFEGLAEQISLLSAGVGEQFDPFNIWHFNEDKDGWTGGAYDDGFINVSNDILTSPAIDINGNMYRHVKMRIKKVGSPTWSAKIVYGAIEQTEKEPDFDLDGIATISIRMQWTGTVTGFTLRLSDIASSTNYYSIDWIAVGRPSPGASSAALLDEQRARSEKDEALAQSITTLDSKVNTETSNLSSTITQGLTTLTTATETNATNISGLSSRIDGELGDITAVIDGNYQTQATENAATAVKLDSVIAKAGANSAAITSEASARVSEDEALSSRIDTLVSTTGANSAAIESEVTARTTQDTALSSRIDTLTATTGENTAAIQTEVAARATEDDALSSRIETLVATTGSNTAAITSEVTARTTEDTALSGRIDTLSSKTDGSLALITSDIETLTTDTTATATKLDGVFAQINPKLAGDTDGWAGDTESYVGVWTEQSARIEEDFALGQRIDTLNADFDNSNALIQSNYKVLAQADSALAMQADVIRARTEQNTAAINTETQARTDADSAMSSRIDTLSAVTDDNKATITSESIARTSEDEALSKRINTIVATTDGNTAAIQTETTARTNADSAMSNRIDTLTATTGDNAAAIQTEVTARTDADSALSTRIETLVATTGTNTASIAQEVLTRTTEDEALSSRIDTLVSTTGTNSALIQTETQARTNADSSLSSRIDTLVSTTGENTAAIQDNFEALTTENSAQAKRIDGVYAQVNPKMAGDTEGWAGDDSPQNLVGAWSERSAIIENDLSMAKRVDGLTTEVGNNKATITEVNKTLVTKNEAVASQINRLAAQMTGGYNGDDLSQLTSGLIHQERTARATDIEGLAEQVSLLSAGVGEQFDSFEIWHFDKNHDGWVNGVYANGWINVRTETINSPVISVDGSMYRHVKLRIQKVGTPTWAAILTYAGGSLTAAEPEYTPEGFAIVNFYMEWSGTITGFSLKLASLADNLNYFKIDWIAVGRPSPGASHAALLREEKARADKDTALTQQFVSLDSQINGDGVNSSSSIVQKLETTATKTDTNATDISNLSSTFNDEVMSSQGIVARNAQTAASASAANASDISGVFAQVNPRMAGDEKGWAGDDSPENLVGVWSERSASQELEYSTSQQFDAVYSRVDGNSAAISTESKTRVDAIKALSEQTTTIRADFEANAGVMQTAITAVADANTALSKRTDTIQSTVGEHTSSIQTAQSAINGINASWTIRADVNGVIGGLGIANDGRTVDFLVSAGRFAIAGQNGSTSTPFVSIPDGTVIDGVTIPAGNYLEDTFIRRASIDTLDIKGNAVTVPVSAFTEAAIEVGSLYETIQSLMVPADMGHTMLNFNAIFNFPGYARKQSILCRIVKGGAVIADNIEVFFSEARSASRATTAYDAIGHNHGGSFQTTIYVNGQSINVGGPVTIGYSTSGSHTHNIDVANDNRNAGSFSLSRHDSTGVAGTYELQMRVADGGTANLSQRYIHAMTMRR